MPETSLALLRAHDRALRSGLTTPEFDCRVRLEISRTKVRESRLPRVAGLIALVAALVVAVGLGAVAIGGRVWGQPAPAMLADDAGLGAGAVQLDRNPAVVPPVCRRQHDDGVLELAGQCREVLASSGVTLHSWTRARIEVRPDGLVVHSGLVLVEVEKVVPGQPPVRVEVSGGVIEVVGTRFVVYEGQRGGEVELLEGAIRFRRGGEGSVELAPGDRARWVSTAGTPGTPGTELGPVGPKREHQDRRHATGARVPSRRGHSDRGGVSVASSTGHEAAAPRPTLSETLDRIAALRASGQYGAALEVIRSFAREEILPRGEAEVLSFEQGTLLEAHRRKDVACAHWARHQDRFPGGSYGAEVVRHRDLLQCEAASIGNRVPGGSSEG